MFCLPEKVTTDITFHAIAGVIILFSGYEFVQILAHVAIILVHMH